MNYIFYIMGKSASGKDSIYRKIVSELDVNTIVIYTTRPKRDHEIDGSEYHFVNENFYDKMHDDDMIIEERIYSTIYGNWTYFTAKDNIDIGSKNYIGIGTLESYLKISEYFGSNVVIPIYIEVDDGIRLMRAVMREQNESSPKYTELCRRFIADSEDFSENKLTSANIIRRFSNNNSFDECYCEIKKYIASMIDND